MQQDSSQKTIIIATISFIVGFALAWVIVANKDSAKEIVSDDQNNAEETSLTANSNMILVEDQTEGVRVTLQKVSVLEPAWVVIHEDDGGKPGRILGAQLFDKGIYVSGTVDLLRGTLAGGTYYAMLHADNGDHAFDPKKDEPVSDDDGDIIMTDFKVTSQQEVGE